MDEASTLVYFRVYFWEQEEYADDEEYEDATHHAAGTAATWFTPLSPDERQLLANMRKWAQKASLQRDSKTKTLVEWLRQIVKPEGKWSDERVIIFTEYRATQKWLHNLLAAEGFTTGGRLMTIYGGLNRDEREEIKAAFQAHPSESKIRILLATDAASEGIDLQNYCHRLVHMEIPWNPNRLEQRNGRIDRHGQKYDPLIFHFVSKGYKKRLQSNAFAAASELEADLEFLMRAAEKVEKIREDLGKVGPVIAHQVEAAMLGKRKQLDTTRAEREAGTVRNQLKFERNLQRTIQKNYEQLWQTKHELGLTPQNIHSVVQIALDLARQPPLKAASEPNTYYLPALTGSWASCTEGLQHPHTKQIRPITFDHEAAKRRDDLVLVHLNHRLVQLALRLLRAEVWTPAGQRELHRVTARTVPNHLLQHPAVIVHARLVVIGGSHHRLHEEIITAGGLIRLDLSRRRFRALNVGQVKQFLDAATHHGVTARTQLSLQTLWPDIRASLLNRLERRKDTRLQNMGKQLNERAEKAMSDIEVILNDLANTIRAELDEDLKPVQLEFKFKEFSSAEREQLTRNVEALNRRLVQIPHEIEAEKEAIRARFANPQARMFPVAVTFLVPERMR